MSNRSPPKIIFLISGKRKSGKDYLSEILLQRLGLDIAVIIRLSAPIKSHWAKRNELQLDELLGSGEYKEKYRKAMIEWSEEVRSHDHGYFCRAAIEMTKDTDSKPIWIISDTRRRSDLCWFNETYKDTIIKTVRIVSTEEVRNARGWTFVKGVDDAETECDLDQINNWDIVFYNNNDANEFNTQFAVLYDVGASVVET